MFPTRLPQPVQDWLTAHTGAEIVCRDGSGAYSDAITQASARATQVSDRWHLWHGLAVAVRKKVAGHATCWTPLSTSRPGSKTGRAPPRPGNGGSRSTTSSSPASGSWTAHGGSA